MPTPRISKARAAQRSQYLRQRKVYLRQHPDCEAHHLVSPGERVKRAVDIHHRNGTIGSLLCDERYWFGICRDCHSFCHTFVKRARELGLIAPAGQWNATSKTQHRRAE